MNIFNTIKSDARGAAILKDWLGAGGFPVNETLSNKRAKVCRTCPHNVSPNWWDKVKHIIALRIRKTLSVRTRLGLTVMYDNELNMCRVCGCCLKLKVHVPIERIKSHTSNIYIYPSFCWVLKESKRP